MPQNLSITKLTKLSISLALSYTLLISQLAPPAFANNHKNSFAATPEPLRVSPAMLAPNITATKTASYPSAPGGVQPGETITYNVTISNSGTDATNVVFSDTIDPHTTLVPGTLNSTALAFDDTFSALGNVRIQVPDGAQDLLANDHDPDTGGNAGLLITTLAGDNNAPFSGVSVNGGQVTATSGNGSFEYNPPAGFTGIDSFTYTVTESGGTTSTATVTLNVSGMIWFVNAAAPAGGDGRLTTPFNCLVGTSCFSSTTADKPGEFIFLSSGTYNDNAALVLLNNQQLIGAAATAPLASITGFTIPAHSDALPPTNQPSPVITSTASGIQLASSNLLRGFTVGNTSTYDIQNTNTATVGNLTIFEVALNGTGGLFRADSGGVLNISFPTATTTSAASNGVHIAGITSGSVSLGSGAISGVAGADVLINGGTITFSCAGNITHTANSAMVDISNHTTGSVTFTGTINATAGTGLQFNNADGTYNFNGATSLNGGDVGIDITAGSSGTFSLGANTSINHNAAGTAFNLNGSNANVTYIGSITDNNGRLVDIDNHDAGTLTFQTGLLNASGPSATGIRVANCNGGTINFNSQTTLSTQANIAIDLSANNTGGTINFNAAGNGLDITTTSGTGFLATGGGTIAVQGSDNSITSTTGTALTVANTIVSANGLNFASISSDGGANPGVILNNTGTLGGLSVTGDAGSANNFSGGTIQNKTGAGISLTNTRNVVLDQMRIVNTDSSGINGALVTNFTFTNGTIVDAGDAGFESAIGFNGVGVSPGLGNNINGTLTVTGSVFTNAFYSGVDLQSDNGVVVNANISNNTFTNPGFSGVNFVGIGNTSTAFNLDNATIANNTINSTGGAGIQIIIGNSNTTGPGAHAGLVTIDGLGRPVSDPSHLISITGNAISVDDTGTQAIIVANSGGNPASRSQTNFIIQNNGAAGSPLLGSDIGTVIGIGNNGFSDMAGLVDNNFIDANHTPGAAGGGGNGISGGNGVAGAGSAWTPRISLVVTNNVITDVNGNGILLVGRGTSGEAYLKIANNNVATPNNTGGVARQSIRVDAGNTSSADDEIYLNIFNNTCPAGGANVCVGSNSAAFIGIRKQGNAANTNDFAIFDAAGGPTLTDPPSNNNVRNFIDALNPHGAAIPDIIAGNSFKRDTTLAPPLLAGQGGVESAHQGNRPVLTQAELDIVFAAAIERWKDTGLTVKQIAAMRSMTFELADLPEVYLAEVSGNHIRIDRDAGGYGWFVDSTPMHDAEFGNAVSNLRRYTNPGDAPAGRMDLLTALMHEMGHRIGLCDSYSSTTRDSLMYGYLTKGERRLPFSAQARNVIPRVDSETHFLSVEPASGETINVNIGTLPAGRSVTITFQVTVNNPPNLTSLNPARISNQGIVSAANFSSVLTDDPAVGGTADPTDTNVDLFDTTTSLFSNVNPSNDAELVTFTAIVTESQPSIDPTGTVDFIDTSNGNAVICNDVPLTAGSAQCQTSSLTAGTHNIRADYSGDGNFDPSQSNIVAQVVNPCTPNPIVTSTADSGAGSLREAVAQVCSGTTITFNLPGAGPHTITLTTDELPLVKDMTIVNSSGESITVSGNNASRVFNINSGKTVNIIGLNLTGGSTMGDGGSVLNNGALTIVNSTLFGNTAAANGGAISSTANLTLINTTLSGNTAGASGGGLITFDGTVSIINSTITNNLSDSEDVGAGDGGGIRVDAGTVTLKNTIVAGNFNDDGVILTTDDISGPVDAASSFNLIGTGGSGGLTDGIDNNQVGIANPGLEPLADNGGITLSHALLPASPAVETGGNANLPVDTFDLDGDTNTGEALPVDGRGPGFPRNADSSDADTIQVVDIGAFELHPSIEDIPNQTTDEDTVRNVTFNLSDDPGSLVTATSSNTTLVPNANLIFSGSGGSRTLQITPAPNQNGTTTITVTVTAANGRTATDTFVLTVNAVDDAPVSTVQDAQVAEPLSGSVNMIFTVALSAPAPAGGSSVDFTTQQEPPAINHATAGQDYTTTSGTVSFAAGEQIKTIQVPVLFDNKKSELNETFLVVLSNPVNLTIADNTATGTIIENDQAGTILISELRTSGPAGAGDDFVEIYNNSDSAHTVNGTGGGYGLFKMGASCSDTPVLIGVIPNGTVIPGRGHFLFTGSTYSLAGYATGDLTLSADIEDDRNVSLFSTADIIQLSTVTKFDAVGFGANTGGLCDLLREGTNLGAAAGSITQHSFFRDQCGASAGACPANGVSIDTNNNVADFKFANTDGISVPGLGQLLGAPGPENLSAPRRTLDVLPFLLDATVSAAASPNRVRDLTADPANNSTFGTLSIRRRFVNNTGAPVTRLRFRIIDITTFPPPAATADLRARTSGMVVVVNVNDATTCSTAGAGPPPCTINVQGTTLETPPAQAIGGAYNSTLATGTVTVGTPLAPGASVNLQFLLGVQTSGSFRFIFTVEALP